MDLMELFAPYKPLTVRLYRSGNNPFTFGIITCPLREGNQAIAKFDGHRLEGRFLKVGTWP